MTFHVPNEARLRTGPMGTTEGYGNNGAFILRHNHWFMRCIASDGEGWEHVSVTVARKGMSIASQRVPTWEEMCLIKDTFWDPEDVVVQFHPARSQYVNMHPHCLHLWRPFARDFDTPPKILVGL